MSALELAAAEPLKLPLAEIEIDPELQARANGVSRATVREYAEAMRPNRPDDPKDRQPARFPPVIVFKDAKGKHWLADGFHRCAALASLPEAEDGTPRAIEVELREGSRRDAQLHAIGANFSHGLKRSNADRRKAALMLLTDATWGKRSDTWIAKQANVSQPFISKLRGSQNVMSDEPRETADGRVMNTSKIGKPAATDEQIASKLTSQIERVITQWPDTQHDALRALLAKLSEALAPATAAE